MTKFTKIKAIFTYLNETLLTTWKDKVYNEFNRIFQC